MKFTLKLREMRKEKGLTQSELAKMIGTTSRIVGSWERGEADMSLEDAVNCADALHCTPNDLCDWYASHPRESAPALPPDEAELVGLYRSCPPGKRRRTLEDLREYSALRAGEEDTGGESAGEGMGRAERAVSA